MIFYSSLSHWITHEALKTSINLANLNLRDNLIQCDATQALFEALKTNSLLNSTSGGSE
ncbi:MAG: hypothetical protein J3R72DRAFT_499526 [Linnemannia gamsii]|nr:MAG: hypothetical protein J3R72DRAFT_499526 [Linnemannia gamsii]